MFNTIKKYIKVIVLVLLELYLLSQSSKTESIYLEEK